MVSVKESFFRGQISKVRNIFPDHIINLRHDGKGKGCLVLSVSVPCF